MTLWNTLRQNHMIFLIHTMPDPSPMVSIIEDHLDGTRPLMEPAGHALRSTYNGDLPRLCINAGKRGLLVELSPGDLSKAMESLTPVSVSRDP